MCSINGCPKPTFARGWCVAHYAKWKKYGDPLVVKQVQFHGKTLQERFDQYTDKTGDCWLWVGHRDANGYGRLNINGQPMLAHRVSWMIHHGDVGNSYVLHKCDNPQCVNPVHLFIGTQQDNITDMHTKGRSRQGHKIGSEHGMAKLNDGQVLQIRRNEESLSEAAIKYGVSETNVRDIRNGKTWKHLLKEQP
jgi:hypothetical protein